MRLDNNLLIQAIIFPYDVSFLLANILDIFSFKPFAELWADIDDQGNFNVNFRRTPYDKEDWDNLTTHWISDDEIVSANLGRSDEEYVNFVSVLPWIFGASETDMLRLFMPYSLRLDWSRIKDKGYRPLILTPRYLETSAMGQGKKVVAADKYSDFLKNATFTLEPIGQLIKATDFGQAIDDFKQGTGELQKLADSWLQVIWDWFSEADRYWTGRLTVRGRPGIRVGQRIRLVCETKKLFPQPMVLYANGVSQDYNVHEGRFLTTITVIRGQPERAFIYPVTRGKIDIPVAEAAKVQGDIVSVQPPVNYGKPPPGIVEMSKTGFPMPPPGIMEMSKTK